MQCLVLGGGGFLGSHLVERLAAEGHAVRSFRRSSAAGHSPLTDIHANPPGTIEIFSGDFLSKDDLTRALEGVDVCYHLISTTIASTSNADPTFDVGTNVLGSLRLLETAVAAGTKRIVFASSGGTVYGVPRTVPITEEHPTNPISSYGITKLAIEKYLHLYKSLHGLDYVALRLANPYGERQRLQAQQGAVAVFLGRALRGEEIVIWGDGEAVRDFVYVADVIDALVAAAEPLRTDECVLNIGSGGGCSLNQILDAIETVTGRPTRRRYTPGRVFDVPVNVLDIAAAGRALGWAPKFQLEEGLRRFTAWIEQSGAL
ncbi:NAD-dependent epimerase/dehydratase family protein [Mesorhizobium sp. BR1-1-16]|uniref:NAD-dependent epimerase/dehydratase family protein n=1 Tax=Mesorhizobium sp. BR1-1-16 TaxID=2876653 RepID=UPI001CCA5968|nr:NAD-dependent epimerase/dehydratase family protein [Mesorhizobium sp. BR1-1-16]MBZ9937685.1 NAD-dependent epimerase/dehydratase family protein [Mesorhizobium sp. BR1-1-16]